MHENRVIVGLLTFIALLVAGQYFLLATARPQANIGEITMVEPPRISVITQPGSFAEVRLSITAGQYDLPLRVAVIPGVPPAKAQSIFVYYEDKNDFETYRSVEPRNIIVAGLGDILPAELRLRGLEGNVRLIASEELAQTLHNTKDGVLIFPAIASRWEMIPPRIDPETLLNWVRGGGIVFVLGATNYYQELLTLDYDIADIPTVGRSAWISGQMEATRSTPISEALGLHYNLVTTGVPVALVERLGGKVLGSITDGEAARTSIAAFKLGSGHIVIFGGGILPTYGPETVSKDIMQILQSGILKTEARPIYRDYLVAGGTYVEDTLSVPAGADSPINVLFFSTDEYHLFYRQYYIKGAAK